MYYSPLYVSQFTSQLSIFPLHTPPSDRSLAIHSLPIYMRGLARMLSGNPAIPARPNTPIVGCARPWQFLLQLHTPTAQSRFRQLEYTAASDCYSQHNGWLRSKQIERCASKRL